MVMWSYDRAFDAAVNAQTQHPQDTTSRTRELDAGREEEAVDMGERRVEEVGGTTCLRRTPARARLAAPRSPRPRRSPPCVRAG
eukprot:1303429-Rhodomonas_salina.7